MTEQRPFKQGLANSTERLRQDDTGDLDHSSGGEIIPNFSDRYETIELLGEGGMGTVYRVRERLTGNDFAMKLLKKELASEKSALKRFEKEAEATSKLTHDNLVSVYEHGYTSDGLPYLVMDCVDGKNLGQLIKENGPLKIENAIDIAMQIGEALRFAHDNGLIHRDLKPSNIILETQSIAQLDSQSLRVKVADFGIAVLANENSEKGETITQTGALVGSPQYMSPEQCTGQVLDPRSDIYSFGCVLYAMLAGKPPFDGGNPVQVILKQINETPGKIPRRSDNSRTSESLNSVILKCLEKDKDHRYKDVASLLIDLQRVRNGEKIRFAPHNRVASVTFNSHDPRLLVIVVIIVMGVFFIRPAKQPEPIDKMPSNLHERAFVHFREKSYAQALPLLEYLAATYKREEKQYAEAFCYQCIAQCHLALKQYDLAAPMYERAINMMNKLVSQDGPSPEATNMITETKTGYIEVLRAKKQNALASAMLRSLDIEKLIELEKFYRNGNVPEDELRVRRLREELEALRK